MTLLRRALALVACFLLAACPAAAQQPLVYAYQNITTNTTTTVKSGPGFLHTICLNTAAANGTVTVYDNSAGSGTKIATITSYASVPH